MLVMAYKNTLLRRSFTQATVSRLNQYCAHAAGIGLALLEEAVHDMLTKVRQHQLSL